MITFRRVVLLVVVILVVWLGLAGATLFVAQRHARDGLAAMEGLSEIASQDLTAALDSVGGDSDDVDEENAEENLRIAAAEFSAAHSGLGSAIVRPLWFTPVLGRQLRSASALSEAAETTSLAAADVVAEFDDVLGSSTATGPDRIDAVTRAEHVLTEFRDRVDDLDLGPDDALIGPLADARSRFAEEHARVMSVLEENLAILAGVGDFLSGPSHYLLLAANNAEMRAGSGMILQVGPLDVSDGVFAVGGLSPTEEMVLETPATDLEPDIEALWGHLDPSRDWRNLNLSPRFDQTARTAAAMWEATGGQPVDGAMQLDVVALEALLALTGPVTLPSGETIGADTVVNDLLVAQYDAYGDRDARRDRLGEVADAVLNAVNERPVSAQELVRTLRRLGEGRHILMWSPDPVQAAAWEALGTDGALPENSMMLSILNRGGNKLDPYLSVTSTLEMEQVDDVRHLTVRVDMANEAPSGLNGYVAGPYPYSDVSEGEYRAVVALTLPAGAANVTTSGGVPVAAGPDGPTQVAAVEVGIPRGSSATVTYDFVLHEDWTTLQVLPSARAVPTQWRAGGGSWSDDAPHTVPLDAGWPEPTGG